MTISEIEVFKSWLYDKRPGLKTVELSKTQKRKLIYSLSKKNR